MNDKIIENLNDQQKQAVLLNNNPLAIIAGAGSGKTRTIAHKIAYLILSEKILPWKILAITFTNKAANELKERIISLIGQEGEKVNVFTYHSLCARILRQEIWLLNYPKNFNIIDNIDQKAILKRGYKEFKLSSRTHSYSSVIDFISKAKNKKKMPQEFLNEAEKDIDKILAKLYDFYLKDIYKTKSLDFDDLLIFANKILKNYPLVSEKWSGKFDYLLVDEFQDTSFMQYEIIKSLTKKNNITVVGDPDQTIYTWRHADPKLILEFNKNFKNSRILLLEENYRSTPQILNAANKLIKNNKKRIAKNLFTTKKDGSSIEYYHGFSEDAEARWVVQKIKELINKGAKLRNIAILFRANYLSNSLERSLIQANINYVLFGGIRFYQREEIKDVISYLKIINNNDEISMRRMINKPSRKIGIMAMEKIERFRDEMNEISIYNAIVNHFEKIPLRGQTLHELTNFINTINKYKAAIKKYPIHIIAQKFLIEVKYKDIWSTFEDQGRIDNIDELIESIKQWEVQNKGKTLNDFLTEISLYTDNGSKIKNDNYISLMTVHTSKGLEFSNVFIFGFSEGIFPSKRALEEGGKDAEEEERRLAYVAVTRAKENLFITSSRGFSIDHKTQKKPSRFISELGINKNKLTKGFIAPKFFSENFGNNDLVEGDKIVHDQFGQGVIVNLQGQLAQIAFKSPYGMRTMMKNHKSIKKVGEK